jgi:hypothetical protein
MSITKALKEVGWCDRRAAPCSQRLNEMRKVDREDAITAGAKRG